MESRILQALLSGPTDRHTLSARRVHGPGIEPGPSGLGTSSSDTVALGSNPRRAHASQADKVHLAVGLASRVSLQVK